jgi:response regulator of citrate/malate metabolism
MTYHVMLVEDDANVAQINSGLIAELPGYQVVAIHERYARALDLIRIVKPDLLLLDVYLMDGDGLQLLHDLRAEQLPVEVIMITAANDTRTVQQALHAGALDFLIKPFSPQRLRAALSRFSERMTTRGQEHNFSQRKLDALLGFTPGEHLPKGIDQETLGEILASLRLATQPMSAEDLSQQLGMSRVTAWRYLEFLITRNQVSPHPVYGAVGRPTKKYQLR